MPHRQCLQLHAWPRTIYSQLPARCAVVQILKTRGYAVEVSITTGLVRHTGDRRWAHAGDERAGVHSDLPHHDFTCSAGLSSGKWLGLEAPHMLACSNGLCVTRPALASYFSAPTTQIWGICPNR